MKSLDTLLKQLDKVQRIGNDRYKACCPAHADKSPSLAIKYAGGRLLIHCFGGCETPDVLAAVGLTFSDIMPDKSIDNFTKDKRPFYAIDILQIIKDEALLVCIYASDMTRGEILTGKDKDRLLLASSRIKHGYEVAKNGI